MILAAHRQNRPWSGERVTSDRTIVPKHDPTCYLCPGNKRVSGAQNPTYSGVYVFQNDHPCVGELAPGDLPQPTGIYKNRRADGIAKVISYGPRHDLTLAEMAPAEVENLVGTWPVSYTHLTLPTILLV